MNANILLVEDDSTARMLLSEVLQGAGYTVTTAPDGETALVLLEQHTFDVVLTDIRMHDIDGIQVLQTAKQQRIPPAVILLTGFGSLETAVAALRSGAQDYLLKPADPDNLLVHVAKALEQRKTEQRQIQAIQIIEQGLAQLQGNSTVANTEEQPTSAASHELAAEKNEQRYLSVGDIVIDVFRHIVTFQGEQLHLTPIEYALISCLARHEGRVLSYQDIVRCSHEHEVDETEAQSLLKAHIRNIRRKMDPNYIVNVRGTGYMLVVPGQDAQNNE